MGGKEAKRITTPKESHGPKKLVLVEKQGRKPGLEARNDDRGQPKLARTVDRKKDKKASRWKDVTKQFP